MLEHHVHVEFAKELENVLFEKANKGLIFANSHIDMGQFHHEPFYKTKYKLLQMLYALSSGDSLYILSTIELVLRDLPQNYDILNDLIQNHFNTSEYLVHEWITNYIRLTKDMNQSHYEQLSELMCNLVRDFKLTKDYSETDSVSWLVKNCFQDDKAKVNLLMDSWENQNVVLVEAVLKTDLFKSYAHYDTLLKLLMNDTFMEVFMNTQSDDKIAYVIENYEVPFEMYARPCLKLNKISILKTLDLEGYFDWEGVAESSLFENIIRNNKLYLLQDMMALGFPVDTFDTEGVTLLFRAIQLQNPLMTAALLAAGGKASVTSHCNRTLLHTAVERNMTNVAEKLVSLGVSRDATDCLGRTPLQAAVLTDNQTTISDILALYDKPSFRGETLHFAASNGTEKAIEILLRKKIDVNLLNEKGNTPLTEALLACKSNNINILFKNGGKLVNSNNDTDYLAVALKCNDTDVVTFVVTNVVEMEQIIEQELKYLRTVLRNQNVVILRFLLSSGMHANAGLLQGLPPIVDAVQNDDVPSMNVLYSFGAVIDFSESSNGITAASSVILLHEAAKHNALRSLKWLLDRGRPIDETSKDGTTALMVASGAGHVGVVRELLNKGASVNSMTSGLTTALHEAARRGYLFVVRLLLESGAQPNVKDKLLSQTPLHWAAYYGHQSVVMELTDKGADIQLANTIGNTALHIAADEGKLPIVMELLERGANINAKNMYGQTALYYAEKRHHERIVRALKFRGGV